LILFTNSALLVEHMRYLINLTIVLLTVSCSKNQETDFVKYEGTKQLLTLNSIQKNGDKLAKPEVKKITPDSVLVGDQFLAKIFFQGDDLNIIDAYADCDTVDNPMVDTVTHKLTGCSRKLVVERDTIFIEFRPTQLGTRTFSPLTILTKGRDKIYRTYNYTFNYRVVGH
jgi:hypothetical protein